MEPSNKNEAEKSNESLPPKPEEPHITDCCGSGCKPCVFDIYEQDLKKWEQDCKAMRNAGTKVIAVDKTPVLCQSEFRAFRLDSIKKLSHNCWLYRFSIPGGRSLGLKTGQHIILRSELESPPITRQYTPVSCLDEQGYFDVAIKIYEDGQMSKYIKTWQVGDMVKWKGPFGDFTYQPNKYRQICMLAAGTGIAPMLQVLHTILNNEEDDTRVQLLYSCCTYNDILMKDELQALQDHWNFNVVYFITREKESQCVHYGDKLHYGHIDKEILFSECPSPSDDVQFLICGTKSFDKDMINHLLSLGFTSSAYYKF